MTHKKAFEIVFQAAAGYASGHGDFRKIHDAIDRAKEWIKLAEKSSDLKTAEKKKRETELITL